MSSTSKRNTRFTYWMTPILVSLIFTTIQAQEIHKWVDKDGNIHFGTVPPNETTSEMVEIEQQDFSTPEDSLDEGNRDSNKLSDAEERQRDARKDRLEETTAEINRLKKESRDPQKCAAQRNYMARIEANYYAGKSPIGPYHPTYRHAEVLAGFYCED
ncbi:DUF4124 domain-containing protein [Pseudomonadota bacterium]